MTTASFERRDAGADRNRVDGPVWVIIPTYNEAENIAGLIHAAVAELERLVPGRYTILVVDDGSPDGTGQIADRLALQLNEVKVLHRTAKTGLGRAYLDGFARALGAGAALVVQMDADFSHDPRYLADLLTAAEDADVVLGSRYVGGGRVEDWGLLRRTISRGGGLYARAVLGVRVHDLTGGFKCIRREVLDAIDLPSVQAAGYVFQIEVTYRALMAGFHVREVPIVFADRTAGSSKMSARIAVEAMWLVPRLRRHTPESLRARRRRAETLQAARCGSHAANGGAISLTEGREGGSETPARIASVGRSMTRSAPANHNRRGSSSRPGMTRGASRPRA